jgi:hypothetical protein
VLACACGRTGGSAESAVADTASAAAPAQPEAAASSLAGTYWYDYPHDRPELVEDHHIVIDTSGGETHLRYHGTSDEFDSAREGYLPAYFIAQATSLQLSRDSISFHLSVSPSEYVTKPVPPGVSSPAGIARADSMTYRGIPSGPVTYTGRMDGSDLVLRTPGGERRYVRMP